MTNDQYQLEINLSSQILSLIQADEVIMQYHVSTAKNGPGEKKNSECTPRGRHVIAEKIGQVCEINTVFVGREATGECYTVELGQQQPQRDWIVTRILRLRGIEPGFNKDGDVDSYDRYIYIHGSPDEVVMGFPGSHGCIRMRNEDVMDLFDRVNVDTEVLIKE